MDGVEGGRPLPRLLAANPEGGVAHPERREDALLQELVERPAGDHLDEACELFEQVALDEDFVDFLTLPAYDKID